MNKLVKNWRVWVWIIVIIGSIAAIGPSFGEKGYVLEDIASNVSVEGLDNLEKGMVIYSIDGKPVIGGVNEVYDGLVSLETSKGKEYLEANNTKLGLVVDKEKSTNLNFGLDLSGGVRAVIRPINRTSNTTVQEIIQVLQTRINVFGLREANFRAMRYGDNRFVEITMAGGTQTELKELLEKQGKFEAKVPLVIDDGSLVLDKEYSLRAENSSIYVDGERYNTGDGLGLAGINIVFEGVGDDGINLTSTVFTGDDIETVYMDPKRSRIIRQKDGYDWRFGLRISRQAAKKFAYVTQNLKIDISKSAGRQTYLDSSLALYLDNELVDTLNIVSDLKGKEIREPSVTGGAKTRDKAIEERARLQSILESGSLPTQIEISSMEVVSPNLGQGFINNAGMAGGAAIIMVVVIIFIRYRKLKVVLPVVITSLSEILIILGMSVIINWTIDLAAIAGIIAAVGTGVDSIIMILDETLLGKEREWGLSEKLKRAFFIVFGAGGTTIGAMLPLMIMGFGLLRGFAVTTSIGVLVGILITRPAFGEIVKAIYA